MAGGWARVWLLMGLCLAGPAWLAGCADDEPTPPQTFAPLTYGYLRPLRLNVGSVQIDDAALPPADPNDLSTQSPAAPIDALRHMAQDRLVATGASGRAVFAIEQASIGRANGMLNGLLKVRLDIYTSDGQKAAYAEAAVARSTAAPDDGDAAMRAGLYALTRQMMSDMNVEFEFQLRRSLGDWLQAGDGPAPPPAAVEQQALPPPGPLPAAGLAPATGTTPASPAYPPGTRFRLVPSPPPGSAAPLPVQTPP